MKKINSEKMEQAFGKINQKVSKLSCWQCPSLNKNDRKYTGVKKRFENLRLRGRVVPRGSQRRRT